MEEMSNSWIRIRTPIRYWHEPATMKLQFLSSFTFEWHLIPVEKSTSRINDVEGKFREQLRDSCYYRSICLVIFMELAQWNCKQF